LIFKFNPNSKLHNPIPLSFEDSLLGYLSFYWLAHVHMMKKDAKMLLKPITKLFRETASKHKIFPHFLEIPLSEMRKVFRHTRHIARTWTRTCQGLEAFFKTGLEIKTVINSR
jgi:hypothetical protein